MSIRREVVESPLVQGIDEILTYSITTTPWAAGPAGPTVKVYDVTRRSYTDVTAVVMPVNTPSALGNVITLSPLQALTIYHRYRIECKFTAGGNTWEIYFHVDAEQ